MIPFAFTVSRSNAQGDHVAELCKTYLLRMLGSYVQDICIVRDTDDFECLVVTAMVLNNWWLETCRHVCEAIQYGYNNTPQEEEA